MPAAWGPTELYNRYDDSGFDAPGILPLRQAHVALLDAVLGAYAADASLPRAAPLFASLREDMQAATDQGWCFDRPWIDGTERYIPKPEFRRRIIEALLQANVERWSQEIDLIASTLADIIAADTALSRKLGKGVDEKRLITALRKFPLKIHRDDARAVLDAGVEMGQWVRFDHGDTPTWQWVGDSDRARKRGHKAADKARRKVEEAARKRAEKVAREAERAEAPRTKRRRAAPPSHAPSLPLPLPSESRDESAEPVVSLVLRAPGPLSRSGIVGELGLTDDAWRDARRRLDAHPDIIRVGIKRGTRYVARSALLEQLVAAIRATAGPDGAGKSAILEALARHHLPLDDDLWRYAIRTLLDAERVRKTGRARGTRYHVAAGRPADVIPFRRVRPRAEECYVTCVPLIPLAVAAGAFSETQTLDGEDCEWVTLEGRTRPGPGLFVAQVVGESMNRRIPNGAWCLWRTQPGGTRRGKVVLAQHRDIDDPELGGRYTVKLYESEKATTDDQGWRHTVIRLKPDSTDPTFVPIVLKAEDEGELSIIATLVEVL